MIRNVIKKYNFINIVSMYFLDNRHIFLIVNTDDYSKNPTFYNIYATIKHKTIKTSKMFSFFLSTQKLFA